MSRVFVLGNASMDISVPVPRLPTPGETLMAGGITRAPGGKGLNQAVVAARAGAEVHFCAPIGRDGDAAAIRTALEAEPLASLTLPIFGAPTDVSMLLVAADGENCIVSTGACADSLTEAAAAAFVAGMAADDFLLIQGNLSLATTLAGLRGRVVLNTAPLRWDFSSLLPRCEVVVANRVEASQITGLAEPGAAARLLGGRTRIVTLGADGCVVADGDRLTTYAAVRMAAVDTTGAGDSFCGVLVAALACGFGLVEAVAMGQRGAALAVTRHGCFAALPTREELAEIFA